MYSLLDGSDEAPKMARATKKAPLRGLRLLLEFFLNRIFKKFCPRHFSCFERSVNFCPEVNAHCHLPHRACGGLVFGPLRPAGSWTASSSHYSSSSSSGSVAGTRFPQYSGRTAMLPHSSFMPHAVNPSLRATSIRIA